MNKISLALGLVFLSPAAAQARPPCNINVANEFLCENGTQYICKLNGRGSTDPDSGRWEKRGKCSESSAPSTDTDTENGRESEND